VGPDAAIANRACQGFAFAIWRMLASARVSESLGQTKVNQMNPVALLAQTHDEIVGFDVAMDKISAVNVFKTTDLQTMKEDSPVSKTAPQQPEPK
jgi:hypothetical protein